MNTKSKWSELTTIVDAENVSMTPEMEELLPLNVESGPIPKPHAKIYPRNVDDVRKVVQWANESGTPLVPVSSGGPHYHGDTAPELPGAVVVDLSRMNKILKIDRRNRLALIQPGVTHAQLVPELKKEGLRINMPLMPRRNKSVIASLLEREPVMSPKFQWNLLEPLRSLEIIWGNGDHFFSGTGFLRGEKQSDWEQGIVPAQGCGAGPSQVDFYKFVSAAQGSMGIVTWASVKCEVLPQARKIFFVSARRLEELIAFTYKLVKFRFGDELFIVNNTCMAQLLSSEADEIATLKSKLPLWTVVLSITGGNHFPQEQVSAQEQDIADIAQSFGLSMTPQVNGCMGHELLKRMLGDHEDRHWKHGYKGYGEEIFFLTTLDKTPEMVKTMQALSDEHGYSTSEIGVYIQPAHQGVCCHCEFILPVDRANRLENQRAESLSRAAAPRLFSQGAFFSRPYGAWAPMVYNADAGAANALRKIKQIFDPNDVMNPGKLCF